jgi:hypothetical protein
VLSETGFSQVHNNRGVATTVVVARYRALPESLTSTPRTARPARLLRSRTRGRLYSCDALLKRLAQDLEHMTAKLGPFIQEEYAVVGQRDFARHGHVADQPRIRNGMARRGKRAGRDTHRADASKAGDTVEVCSVDGLDQEPVCKDHRAIGRHYVVSLLPMHVAIILR